MSIMLPWGRAVAMKLLLGVPSCGELLVTCFSWEQERNAFRKNLEMIISYFDTPLTRNLDSAECSQLRGCWAEVSCAAARKLLLQQLRQDGLRCCQEAALQLLPKWSCCCMKLPWLPVSFFP